MPDGGAIILNAKKDGLFDPIDPEGLAAYGLLWNQETMRFSPWQKSSHHGLIREGSGTIFKSEAAIGEETIVICGRCTSSMDVAWHFIEQDRLQVWDSILAVEQTAGRGQRQRIWMSSPGNIYAAWRWPNPKHIREIDDQWRNFTSLMAGYLLARIFAETFGFHVKIKWPNDILVNEKKIGGILTEARNSHLVVGIGINVVSSPDSSMLRNDFAVQATNLQVEGIDAAPLSLWMNIVEKARRHWLQLTGSVSPDEFINALKPYLAWVGEKVLVKAMQQDPFEAVIAGISYQGGLILKSGGKETVIYAGSIIPA